LDSGKISVYAVSADGVALDKLEAAIDTVLEDVKANGVTPEELQRAQKAYIAEYIYESDNQSSLARRYGWGLVVGRTIAQIDEWPARIAKVTRAEVQAAARKYLDVKKSVTGTLRPEMAAGEGARPALPATPANRT
jgi:zinc protease